MIFHYSNPNAPNSDSEILWNVLSETYLTTKNSPQIPPTFVAHDNKRKSNLGGVKTSKVDEVKAIRICKGPSPNLDLSFLKVIVLFIIDFPACLSCLVHTLLDLPVLIMQVIRAPSPNDQWANWPPSIFSEPSLEIDYHTIGVWTELFIVHDHCFAHWELNSQRGVDR